MLVVGEGGGVDAGEGEHGLAGMVDEGDVVVAFGESLFRFFQSHKDSSFGREVRAHHARCCQVGELHGVGNVGVNGDFAVNDIAAGVAVEFLLRQVDDKLYRLVAVRFAVDGSYLPCAVKEVHIVFAEHHYDMPSFVEEVEVIVMAVARYFVGTNLAEGGVDDIFERGVGAVHPRREHVGEMHAVVFSGDYVGVDDIASVVAVQFALCEVEIEHRPFFAGDLLTVDIVDVPFAVEARIGIGVGKILYSLLHGDSFDVFGILGGHW